VPERGRAPAGDHVEAGQVPAGGAAQPLATAGKVVEQTSSLGEHLVIAVKGNRGGRETGATPASLFGLPGRVR
jgi:hypothetical protein